MNSYPHMCRDGHAQIGHSDSRCELCPLCRVINERDDLKTELFKTRQECDAYKARAESAEHMRDLEERNKMDHIATIERMEEQIVRLLKAQTKPGAHDDCSEDFYFGSEDRGDNRCELCRVRAEVSASLGR